MEQFIGNKIKVLRKSFGLTQKELADKIGIARATLSGYEKQTSQPDIETLKKLAHFFSVSTDFLLGLEYSTPNGEDFMRDFLYYGKQLNGLNRAIIIGKMAELVKEQNIKHSEEKDTG